MSEYAEWARRAKAKARIGLDDETYRQCMVFIELAMNDHYWLWANEWFNMIGEWPIGIAKAA